MAEDQGRSDEELMQEFQEELRAMRVEDLLVQTLYTVSSLGYHKLGSEHRNLGQAKLAIDALQALLPVVKDAVSEDVTRDFQQVVANMQLAYAGAVTERPPAEPGPQAETDAAKESKPIYDQELGKEG